MTRLGAVFWFIVVLVAGFTTFKVKYAVQDLEDQLNRVRRQTIAEQQEIRVLNAEWTYLTQPERLAELNRRFLGLAPIAAKQLQRSIADIPLRPPATPAAPLDEVIDVAAAPPGADQPAAPTLADAAPAGMAASRAAAAMSMIAAAQAAAPLGPAAPATQEPAANSGPDTSPNSLDALIARTALPVTPAVLARAPIQTSGPPPARVQMAKDGSGSRARSLDALIAQIAETQ